MSEGSQAADQVTKEVAQLTVAAAKLAGAGLKNLAALALALAKNHKKLRGKTRLSRLLREGSELKVVPLPKDKMKEFCKEAKRYGILFSAIQENEDGTIDILVRAQDAAKINRVFERINYHGLDEYKKEKDAEKNSTARAASEKDSPLYGQDESRDSSSTGTAEKTKTTSEPEKTEQPERSEHSKQNVRQKMEQLKKQQHMSSQKAPAKAKNIPLGKER